MCLAIPGQVLEIDAESSAAPMGKVSFGGIQKQVCLAYVPEARVGDYVLVHVGFAIQTVDEREAHETLRLLREMDELSELDPPPGETGA